VNICGCIGRSQVDKSPDMKPDAQIIGDIPGLENLVPEWWVLWKKIPASTVFQTPAWILPFWRTFAPGKLCAIAIRIGERLAGLAPLYLETGNLGRRVLPIGIGLSDYCDVLLDPELASPAGAQMAEALAAIGDWEVCEFSELHANACALQLATPQGSSTEIRDGSIAPVLEIPPDANTVWDAIPRKKRHDLRHATAATGARGEARFSAATAENAQDWLSDLVRLHNARWISRGEPGVFADPRVVQFHSLALPHLFARDLARIYRLTIGATVSAVYYGFFDRGRCFGYSTGFNPAFPECSPGALVLAHAIEQGMRSGAREFHFLRGHEAYKFSWGAMARQSRSRLFVRSAS
jgi:CelD/BcsL family acetyltransferase involved in cellulose biosynthesis